MTAYNRKIFTAMLVLIGVCLNLSGAARSEGVTQEQSGALTKQQAIALVQDQLILVHVGTFKMGSDTGNSNEKPVHEVTIQGDWLVMKHEMSQKIYKGLMGDNPAQQDDLIVVGDDLPAVHMTQQQALDACNTAGMELPSEALWEYIARGGNRQLEYPTDNGSFNKEYINVSTDGPKPVTWGKPGPFGLFNLGGNVWEMTKDQYKSYVDGHLLSGENIFAERGGAWFTNFTFSRGSTRNFRRNEGASNVGVRCVCESKK